MLFTVSEKLPEDSLYVSPGENIHVVAQAYGNHEQVPLDRLEIVGHGKVLRRVSATDPEQSPDHLPLYLGLPVQHGIWVAAWRHADGLKECIAETEP